MANWTPDDLTRAEQRLAEVAHGKHAFLGSSAWSDYVHARLRVEEIHAAIAHAKGE